MGSIFVFSTVLALAMAVTVSADLNLVLLHANDMHSHFDETDVYSNECSEADAALCNCYGGFARVAHVVSEEKRKANARGVPALFMVAGDNFQGTPYFSFFKWKPVVDFINQLKPNVMVNQINEHIVQIINNILTLNNTQAIARLILWVYYI